jgi:DNA-binding transcriptional regulator YiaG
MGRRGTASLRAPLLWRVRFRRSFDRVDLFCYADFSMWSVIERNDVAKSLRRFPQNIVEKYEAWKLVATTLGPAGLRALKGSHFEKIDKTRWSSRLTQNYRVIFSIFEGILQIEVIDVGTHNVYKKMRETSENFAEYRPARRHVRMTPGITIRSLREMQEISQSDLARETGLSQGLISNLEHDRIELGLARAKIIAKALHTHPAVLLFP